MLSTIYWILATLIMFLLLIATIKQMIHSHRSNKEFRKTIKMEKELTEKYSKYINMQIEQLKKSTNKSEEK